MSWCRLDLEECFGDSPSFQAQLSTCDTQVTQFELGLKTLLRFIRNSVNAHDELGMHNLTLADSLFEFGAQEMLLRNEQDNLLGYYAENVRQIEQHRRLLTGQIETLFFAPLESFLQKDMVQIKELRKQYERTGTEFFHANARYMAKRSRDLGLFDAAQEVADTRREYHEASLDYAAKLNEINERKDAHFYEAMTALVHANLSFIQQQQDIVTTLIPILTRLSDISTESKGRLFAAPELAAEHKRRILQRKANGYNPLIIDRTPQMAPIPSMQEFAKQGYLYKRSSHAMRPNWSRRFFSLKNDHLEYYSLGAKSDTETIPIDIRLCSIKPVGDAIDRRFCFEIVSPIKSYMLQAENDIDLTEWVEALQAASRRAIHSTIMNDSKLHAGRETGIGEESELLKFFMADRNVESALTDQIRYELAQLPGNNVCADCRAADPEWASINFGIMICIECSGIHRSLGVQKSKVRSLRLDHWENEHLQIMRKVGNEQSWGIFEAEWTSDSVYDRPSPKSDHSVKELWIIAKYDLMKFVPGHERRVRDVNSEEITSANDNNDGVNEEHKAHPADEAFNLLWTSVEQDNLSQCIMAIAMGAPVDGMLQARRINDPTDTSSPDQQQPVKEIKESASCTPLQRAVQHEHWALAVLLLFWGAKVDLRDVAGRNVFHYLAASRNPNTRVLMSALRRNNSVIVQTDAENKDPIEIAADNGHAELATILRIIHLESTGSNGVGASTSNLRTFSPPEGGSANISPPNCFNNDGMDGDSVLGGGQRNGAASAMYHAEANSDDDEQEESVLSDSEASHRSFQYRQSAGRHSADCNNAGHERRDSVLTAPISRLSNTISRLLRYGGSNAGGNASSNGVGSGGATSPVGSSASKKFAGIRGKQFTDGGSSIGSPVSSASSSNLPSPMLPPTGLADQRHASIDSATTEDANDGVGGGPGRAAQHDPADLQARTQSS